MVCFSPVELVATRPTESKGSEYNQNSDKGPTLETSATRQIPQAKNIPYQPLLIKPVLSLLANAEKAVFFKTSLLVFIQRR